MMVRQELGPENEVAIRSQVLMSRSCLTHLSKCFVDQVPPLATLFLPDLAGVTG